MKKLVVIGVAVASVLCWFFLETRVRLTRLESSVDSANASAGMGAAAPVTHALSAKHVERAATTTQTTERALLASSDDDLLAQEVLDDEDRERLRAVNAALAAAKLVPVDPAAAIRRSDIAALRALVDDAEKKFEAAEDRWGTAAHSATSPLVKRLVERLRRGESGNLPVMNKANSLRRQSPHEAVTQVIHEGKNYVVRVSPDENTRLAETGRAMDDERTRRAHDYNTLVRGLFMTAR